MTRRTRVLYFVLLSAVAAALLLTVFSVSRSQENSVDFAGKALVGIAFIASCLLGMSMAIHPNWAKKILGQSLRSGAEEHPRAQGREYRGHHPDCAGFQGHRLSVGGRDFCAGCLGILFGAAISVVLMMFYLASDPDIARGNQSILLAFGFGTISIAYVEAALEGRNPVVHLVVNSLMVVGLFLLVAGMLEATETAVFGLLAVMFSFLWMDTRIELSMWRHSLLCAKCPESCKMY